MLVMVGLKATEVIRKWESEVITHIRITIVALTAGAFKEGNLKCLQASMDEFLTKPVDVISLKQAFQKFKVII